MASERVGSGAAEVDAYLASAPPPLRRLLAEVRTTVRRIAPEAEEIISYRMPAFRLNGVLVYYAAFRDHCSLFVASRSVWSGFADELRPFVSGRGTLRFTPEHPLPGRLLTRIVRARVAENRARVRRGNGRVAGSPGAPTPRTKTPGVRSRTTPRTSLRRGVPGRHRARR